MPNIYGWIATRAPSGGSGGAFYDANYKSNTEDNNKYSVSRKYFVANRINSIYKAKNNTEQASTYMDVTSKTISVCRFLKAF